MRRLAELWRRVRHWRSEEQSSRDLDAEMQFHLDMVAAEERERGLSDAQAASAARRQFGNLTRIAEQSGEVWGWPAAERLLRDVRLAGRALAKRPGFCLVAVVSLGLGLGSVTAVATIANALFLRAPAAVSHPENVVALYTSREDGAAYGHSSFPDFRDLAASVPALSGLAASEYDVLKMDETGERRFTERVTGNYFDVLGIVPAAGRTFRPAETVAGQAEPVVVISHSLWHLRFAADPGAIGRTIGLGGRPYTIVGVAPPGLASRFLSLQPDLWVPLGLADQDAPARADRLDRRTRRDLRLLGRLAAGATLDQAAAQLPVVERRLQAAHPDDWKDLQGRPRRLTMLSERAARIDPANRELVTTVGGFFAVVSILVLLAACANVMSLFIAETGRRRREVAVRLAVGAGRGHVAGLLLAEGLVIGLAGGALGVVMAVAALGTLSAMPMPFGIAFQVDLSVDRTVLAVAFALSVAASLLVALAPSIQASRLHVLSSLQREGTGLLGTGRRISLRDAVVVAQLAAALVLVSGSTLVARSLRAAGAADLGIDPDRIATMTKRLPPSEGGTQAGVQYIRTLADRLAAAPGVSAVAFSSGLEMAGMNSAVTVSADGADTGAGRFGICNGVTPGYLEMLSVRMRRGRTIRPSDTAGAPLVAVVTEAMADQLWPGRDPIGQRFVMARRAGPGVGDRRGARVYEVVGVAGRGAYWEVGSEDVPYCWTALLQDCPPVVAVSLRGSRSASEMVSLLRTMVEVEPDEVTPIEPSVLADRIAEGMAPLRVAARVLGWGGAFALGLAMLGVFGALSFTVARRTREFAIRTAVGARRHQVLGRVVFDGLRLAVAGVVVGTAVAVPLAWLVRSELYGVSPADPVAFGVTAAILVSVAVLGSIVPARRALAIDPVAVLKEE